MALVGGYEIPEELHYSIDHGIWLKPDQTGDIILGLALPRCVLLGQITFCRQRRIGTVLRSGMSCATLEAGRRAVPVPTPVAGVVVAVNPLVRGQPQAINRDPYGSGWLVRLSGENWPLGSRGLLSGAAAIAAFAAQLELTAARPYIM